jgi:flagellar biosynthetic protein FliQ
MGPGEAIDIARDAIVVALKLGAPIMLIGLAIGLAVSLFQALTQIQEMTLTFVPKIVVIMISLILLLPFMLATLTTFTERLVDRIIAG